MKLPTVTSILEIAVLTSCVTASVIVSISKVQGLPKVTQGRVSSRATISESLINNLTQYTAQVSVGTPPQVQTLAIDTGSSDVWLVAATANLCSDITTLQQDYDMASCVSTFDGNKSSSFKVVEANGFDISYADGSVSQGDYVTDDFNVGGATIKALQMGLGYYVSVPFGLMGIGYDVNEASADFAVYPSIIDQMMSQGLITTKAYSLYLDDYESSSGSIIFGGLDSDKYHGNLLQLPVVPDFSNGTMAYTDLAVAMTDFSITSQDGKTQNLTTPGYDITAVLDSGTTFTYLPNTLLGLIYKEVNAQGDGSGLYYVPCSLLNTSPDMTFNFGFGGSSGIQIAVPIKELVFDPKPYSSLSNSPTVPGINDPCVFGLLPGDSSNVEVGSYPYILGDSFLRSAYVVYDLSNNVIALAPTNFNSTSSNIVEFKAGATAIPSIDGAVVSTSNTMSSSTKVIQTTSKSTMSVSTNVIQTASQSTAAGSTTSSETITAMTSSTSSRSTSTAGATATPTSRSIASRAFPPLVVVGMSILGSTFILA